MLENEIGRAFTTHGEMRNAYKILVGKPEGKIPLRRPSFRQEMIILKLILGKWGLQCGLL
jgi:hypothetical protein